MSSEFKTASLLQKVWTIGSVKDLYLCSSSNRYTEDGSTILRKFVYMQS